MSFRVPALLALVCAAGPVAAQAPEPAGPASDAAASITAGDVARRVGLRPRDPRQLGAFHDRQGVHVCSEY